LTVPSSLSPTAAVFPAVAKGTNDGRGSDTKASSAVITNGSKIIVPEGAGLLVFQDGELTAVATDSGAYIWDSENPNSQSIFADNGFNAAIIKQSWERYKFGGRPSAQQLALFVNLKELPNNKFGTQSAIYWDDAYLNAQVGAITRGTYTLKIVDPIAFTKNFLPAPYLQNGEIFDFTDRGNAAANQIFAEIVGSLAGAFSGYTNDSSKGNRMSKIQQDSVGFARSLSQVVDESYQWSSDRGLTVSKVAILAIEYDDPTKELLRTVQRADALSGSRGNSNLQASVAAGIESAGEVSGSAGILGVGLAAGGIGVKDLQQPAGASNAPTSSPSDQGSEDNELLVRLGQLKSAFDNGLITQDDYDRARAQALGLG